jgi:fused signal recognition particle receptor
MSVGVVVVLIIVIAISVYSGNRIRLRGERQIESSEEADLQIGGAQKETITESVPPPKKAESVLERFTRGLSRSSAAIGGALSAVFSRSAIDEALYEDLEEALLGADVGVRTSTAMVDAVRNRVKADKISDPMELRPLLKEAVSAVFDPDASAMCPGVEGEPYVVLVVGVNGAGKTTTIGKLAAMFAKQGKKVLLGAGDTFRAGAIEQLKVWADRTGADFVAHKEGADPAAVLYDALEAARARGCDVVICDTAGRLQAKKTLMNELSKVHKVVGKAVPEAPHEVLLVLDGTTGQNALSQGKIFGEVAGVTGVVVTKLDGTARGGVVIAINGELGLPVKFIGIGEQVDDLRPFDANSYVDALLTDG